MKIIHSFDTWQGGREQQQDDWGFNEFLNNDAVLQTEGALAVVADGMGGLALGQEASRLAKTLFLDAYHEQMVRGGQQHVSHVLRRCIEMANEGVLNLSRSHQLEGDVGTTLVATVVKGDYLYWISVGDSRIYLVRNNQLAQLTLDHNYETELLLSNTEYSEARKHPESHALTSYLGIPDLKEIDQNIKPLRLQPDDLIILTTDGLFNVLQDNEILKIASRSHPNKIANFLISAVQPRSSPEQDNTTVLTFKVGMHERHNSNGSAMPPDRDTRERQGRAYHGMGDDRANEAHWASPPAQKKKSYMPLLVGLSVILVALAGVLLYLSGALGGGSSACQAVDDSFVINEQERKSLDILLNDACPMENLVQVTIENTSGLGLASWDDQEKKLIFKANNKPGEEEITYQILFRENGKESTEKAKAKITVMTVNDPPRAVADRRSISSNGSIIIFPLENDTDPDEDDNLSIVEIGDAQFGNLVQVDSEKFGYRYTATNNATGQDRIPYTITDGEEESEGEIIIDIDFRNSPPIAVADTIKISAEEAIAGNELELNVLGNDRDPDQGDKANLQIVSHSDPDRGGLVLEDGVLRYRIGQGKYTSDSFTYTITDGVSPSREEAEVIIEIAGGNTGFLTAITDRAEIEQDSGPVEIDVLRNDIYPENMNQDDLVVLRIEDLRPDDAGEVDVINNGKMIRFTPAEGFSGDVIFFYVLTEGEGGESSANVRIKVTPLNDSQVDDGDAQDGEGEDEGSEDNSQGGDDNLQGGEGGALELETFNTQLILGEQEVLEFTLTAILENNPDLDVGSLSIERVQEASDQQGSVELDGNFIKYTPREDFTEGIDSFIVTVTDGENSGPWVVLVDVKP